MGRAMDSCSYFHDVTWTKRLRDSPYELYKFTETIDSEMAVPIPVGVFTLIADCYSPTCSRDRLCYSIICPRRFEQVIRC